MCLSKGPNKRESVYRQESLVNIIRDPHCLNSRQGLLYSSGVGHQEWLRWTRRDSSQMWRNGSPS